MQGFNFEIQDIIDICYSMAKSSEKDAEMWRKLGVDYNTGFADGTSNAYKLIAETLERHKKELHEAAN